MQTVNGCVKTRSGLRLQNTAVRMLTVCFSITLRYVIRLKPGFHMIATTAQNNVQPIIVILLLLKEIAVFSGWTWFRTIEAITWKPGFNKIINNKNILRLHRLLLIHLQLPLSLYGQDHKAKYDKNPAIILLNKITLNILFSFHTCVTNISIPHVLKKATLDLNNVRKNFVAYKRML